MVHLAVFRLFTFVLLAMISARSMAMQPLEQPMPAVLEADREQAVAMWVESAGKGIDLADHNLKFFLSPWDKLRLAPRYPALLWNDRVTLGLAGLVALIALLIPLAIGQRLARGRKADA